MGVGKKGNENLFPFQNGDLLLKKFQIKFLPAITGH